MSEQSIIGVKAETRGDRWGDRVDEERQAALDVIAEQQRIWVAEPTEGRSASPLRGVQLTGAEVGYLAARALAGPDAGPADLADAVARLTGAIRWDLDLSALHLEGANLGFAHLEGANLSFAHLEGANLSFAHLEGANLREAHLEKAIFIQAQLKGATLTQVHMEGANLREAHLEKAKFLKADLAQANLGLAHLEGTDFTHANLVEASLRTAQLDEYTNLTEAVLGPGVLRDLMDRMLLRNRNAALGDIKWRDADLTVVPWEKLRRLGDERNARFSYDVETKRAVVRAYRQVAKHLHDQGMADEADRFAYRAQIHQRGLLWRTFRLPQYLFSWLLALLAGYGYRPERTLFWYLMTTFGFMWGYLQVTHGIPLFGLHEPSGTVPLQWYEAFVLSVASFHGRGFFPQGISLGDPVAILAASEAVIGLFIEISFIATFTQRYFGAK